MLHILLLLMPAAGAGDLISQWPKSTVQSPGETVALSCYQNHTTHIYMFWYLQPRGHGLILIASAYTNTEASYEKGYNKSKFPISRNETKLSVMTVMSITAGDAATYFCAASESSSTGNNQPLNFGEGTRLTVLEDGLNITEPEVAIFAPSQKEIKEKKKATLVCVATGFYPDHIKVTWIVNGGERTEGVGTDEHATRENQTKMYSLTSRLRIPSQEWFNPKNNFQCLVSFYGKDSTPKIYPKAIQGVAGCSVTEELYQRSSRTGYFVYLMLFCKSILYGLFVMGLILRSKKMH